LVLTRHVRPLWSGTSCPSRAGSNEQQGSETAPAKTCGNMQMIRIAGKAREPIKMVVR